MRKMTILAGLSILTILMVWLSQEDNSQSVSEVQKVAEAVEQQTTEQLKAPSKHNPPEVNLNKVNSGNPTEPPLTEAFKAEIIKQIEGWLVKQGYTKVMDFTNLLNPDKVLVLSDYDTYDNPTLESLAKEDARAALALGVRLYENYQYDEAEPYLYQAAVHGYMKAISNIHGLKLAQAEDFKRDNQLTKAEAAYIESLAWHQVINLRFSPGSENLSAGRVESYVNKERFEYIKRQALIRAKAIYAELKQQRKALELGEFDNHIPELVRRYYLDF